MFTINTQIGYDTINRFKVYYNGGPFDLSAVTKIELKIPLLGITISNETSNAYPIKWTDNASSNIIEFQIGNQTILKNKFVISTTCNTTANSNILSNVSSDVIKELIIGMTISGIETNKTFEVISIKKIENQILLTNAVLNNNTDISIEILRPTNNDIYDSNLYFYSLEYPNGYKIADIKLNIQVQ